MTDILIIQGHPDAGRRHFCHALADAYRAGAEAAGHKVTVIDTGSTDVPTLRDPDRWTVESGPDFIADAQAAILKARHVVLVYPLWMGTVPAHLKAWLEWAFASDFGFIITERGFTPKLRGKSARIVVTMGMPAVAYRYYFFEHSLRSLRRNILGFAGFGPIRESLVGMVESPAPHGRQRWLTRMRALGKAAR